MEKVLVGLSGGVDSTAVALLLQEEGYEVHGVYLSFCHGDGEERARYVADRLGIPLTVAKRERRFQNRVIEPFLSTYEKGLTPNPCVECNRCMKFACLLEEADRLGIEKVATGHYAAITKREDGRMELCRGKDRQKDQSYFLWKLTQKQLSRILFPLAKEEKEEIKLRARQFVSPEERESMEICFIPDGDTGAFLEKHCGGEPGDFVDTKGAVLGRHKGLVHYTVGQRRGLGIAMGERCFVTALCPEQNRVILGKEADDRLRNKQTDSGKAKTHRHRDPQTDCHQRPDPLGVLFAPVLGGQNDDRTTDAGGEHLDQRMDLVAHVHAGNRGIAQGVDHQIIRKVHQKGDQPLQRNRNCQPHKALIIVFVTGNITHFRASFHSKSARSITTTGTDVSVDN